MQKLTTQQANTVRNAVLMATGTANEQRKDLKAAFRAVINDTFTDEAREVFHKQCGQTISRVTDMVGLPVLLNVIVHAVGEALQDEDEGWALSTALNQLVNAWCDDTKCHPSARGSGVQRGYHTNMYDAADCIKAIHNMAGGRKISLTECIEAAAIIGRLRWQHIVANSDTNPLIPNMVATDYDEQKAYQDGMLEERHLFNKSIEGWRGYNSATTVADDWLPECYVEAVFMVTDNSEYNQDDIEMGVKNVLHSVGCQHFNIDKCSHVVREIVATVLTENVQDHLDTAMEAAANPVDDPVTGEPIDLEADFKAVEPIPLDPNLKVAVDALLEQATGGAIQNSDYYTNHIERLNTEVMSARNKIRQMLAEDNSAPPAPVVVDGATLTYEVVRVKAMDLFTDAKGNKSNKLDFEVNTLVWRDDSGNVVRHPKCPDIDTTYKFRMHHLIKYLTAKEFGQHSWFHGHTGTGKTTFVEQVEARLGFPIERLNLDSNLERSDIVGNIDIVVEDGAPKSQFTEGLLPRAMVQPMVFILDEIDAGRADMLFVLQRALENKGLTLTEDAGRVVIPHKLFTFAATANSRGQGDEFGWYQGVRPMNLALLNRFGAFIEVTYLDEDDELQFVKDAYPKLDTGMAEQMCAFTQLVRNSFMNGEISQTMSPRNLHAMCQYYMHFTAFLSHDEAWNEVVETCVSDAAPADNQQRIAELANRVFAGGL